MIVCPSRNGGHVPMGGHDACTWCGSGIAAILFILILIFRCKTFIHDGVKCAHMRCV